MIRPLDRAVFRFIHGCGRPRPVRTKVGSWSLQFSLFGQITWLVRLWALDVRILG